jgi:hypothetical protein
VCPVSSVSAHIFSFQVTIRHRHLEFNGTCPQDCTKAVKRNFEIWHDPSLSNKAVALEAYVNQATQCNSHISMFAASLPLYCYKRRCLYEDILNPYTAHQPAATNALMADIIVWQLLHAFSMLQAQHCKVDPNSAKRGDLTRFEHELIQDISASRSLLHKAPVEDKLPSTLPYKRPRPNVVVPAANFEKFSDRWSATTHLDIITLRKCGPQNNILPISKLALFCHNSSKSISERCVESSLVGYTCVKADDWHQSKDISHSDKNTVKGGSWIPASFPLAARSLCLGYIMRPAHYLDPRPARVDSNIEMKRIVVPSYLLFKIQLAFDQIIATFYQPWKDVVLIVECLGKRHVIFPEVAPHAMDNNANLYWQMLIFDFFESPQAIVHSSDSLLGLHCNITQWRANATSAASSNQRPGAPRPLESACFDGTQTLLLSLHLCDTKVDFNTALDNLSFLKFRRRTDHKPRI